MTIIVPLEHVRQILKLEDTDDIINQLKNVYSGLEIDISLNKLSIHIDDINLMTDEVHNNLINLCEKGNYKKALTKAISLLDKYNESSELNRIIAQIYFETNEIEKAENYLIQALKLNPRNTSALILMGNFYYSNKDTQTALKYWNSALKFNPDDYLSLSNIAGLLANQNELDQAKKFFEESLSINQNFPNVLYGLALVYFNQNNFEKSFSNTIKALKNSSLKDKVNNNSLNLLLETAKKLTKQNLSQVESEIHKLKDKIVIKSGKDVEISISDNIDTAAKLEVAEYHKRNKHRLIYKKQDLTVPHLMLHELYHLQLIAEAREFKNNYLFTSTQYHQEKFSEKLSSYKKALIKKGIPTDNISRLIESLFSGLNSQVFNTPIDLFIEQRIFENHQSAQPIQVLSLYNLISEGIKATTDKQIINLMPKTIISKSKILNMVNALWLKDYYGINLISKFKSNKIERQQAEDFYNEYLEYAKDKEPSEEYELLQNWAEDLKLDDLFNLKKEETNKSKTPDEVMDEINKDPYGVEDEELEEVKEQRRNFIESHSNDEVNTAVVMYMVSALDFFKNFSKEEIKKIAFEFATLGMTGIDPKKTNYEVPSINKKMSGYQALSYYYVSWALAIPEMLSKLGMPFDEEFDLAQQAIRN
ncbi:tetratricopeptide repeat protein [Mesohalobacter halotolerans]|uniref:Tetratricopeptide repeat protein n=1 Tax=Mesohalobacter halotolerans TaxID=1883405 RepID=A0A4V6AMQ6_9FLAO|nr:tetratricopeptide repeat protein [Mesohalobacter halotolerans]TKS57405.1 tetratricopeptide repeat protein [Mesohalobacter halotolerans]